MTLWHAGNQTVIQHRLKTPDLDLTQYQQRSVIKQLLEKFLNPIKTSTDLGVHFAAAFQVESIISSTLWLSDLPGVAKVLKDLKTLRMEIDKTHLPPIQTPNQHVLHLFLSWLMPVLVRSKSCLGSILESASYLPALESASGPTPGLTSIPSALTSAEAPSP
ncbi:hypothetical protein Q5P01_021837 [Channa striata]|uniref:Uncharacterized protein n=1 Tax=Channa striata TaxID=64152 RepID=A0AA88S106_CHASR|nr:hypothetical protein Q5P01_021837 [Channa striata]